MAKALYQNQTLISLKAWVTQSLFCWVQHNLNILMLRHYRLHYLFIILDDYKKVMLHRNFLKNNCGGLDTLFTNILIHSNNYVQHWPKKKCYFFFFWQTFQSGILSSNFKPTHRISHFTFSSLTRTWTFNKRTYKNAKAFSNRLMPTGSNPVVNFIKIPRVPL